LHEPQTKDNDEIPVIDLPDRFRVISLIGRGGMGDVYHAYDQILQRDVAVKVLRAELSTTVDAQKRFLREARTLANLDHPNIIKLHLFGITAGSVRPFQVTDLLSGTSLADYLGRHSVLSLREFGVLAEGVLSALQFAASIGVVHRDIKPSNIFLCKDSDGPFHPVLLDFGIATFAVPEGPTLTATNSLVGSPLYMSPEQCRGEQVSELSDIYSAGCVFYECLTGIPPFAAETAVETMLRHMGSSVPRMFAFTGKGQCNAEICKVVCCCLQKDPLLRPPSVAILQDQIHAALASELPTDVTFSASNSKARGRITCKVATVAAFLIALLLAVSWSAVSFSRKKGAPNEAFTDLPALPDSASIASREKEIVRCERRYEEALRSNEDASHSGRILFENLLGLRDRYWSEKHYRDAMKVSNRLASLSKYVLNGKNRTVDFYVDDYYRCRDLAQKKTPAEQEKFIAMAMDRLKRAELAAQPVECVLGKVAVSSAYCREMASRGEIESSCRYYLSTRELLIKSDFHNARMFTTSVGADWPELLSSQLLSGLISDSVRCSSRQDAMIMCQVLIDLMSRIPYRDHPGLIDNGKERMRSYISRFYPKPPLQAAELKNYEFVITALKTSDLHECADFFKQLDQSGNSINSSSKSLRNSNTVK
jgi:serine/threonine protein kinase